MPLTVIVLGYLWRVVRNAREVLPQIKANERGLENKKRKTKNKDHIDESFTVYRLPFSAFLVGLIAGTLPLIHAHSLVVLFVVSAFLFFFSLKNWKEWVAFGVGVLVIAVPELIWTLSGSATNTSEFIAWHFGWHAQQDNIFWFWLKNTGLFIPLLVAAFLVGFLPQRHKDAENTIEKKNTEKIVENTNHQSPIANYLIYFLPFLFLFIVSNVAKLAPWEWDNIKVLIYWFIGSIPFAAFALATVWQKGKTYKAVAVLCLIVLMFSGGLDIWRTVSGQIKYEVFDKDAVEIAELIKKDTEPNALFLNAPTYNSAVVLSGRRSLMRYIGHLSSHGIAYQERERDLKQIYSGASTADILLKKYNIEYILISPKEMESLQVNEGFFRKYKVAAQVGAYKVYKVR